MGCWWPEPGERRHVSQLFADSLGPEFDSKVGLPKIKIELNPDDVDQGLTWLAKHGWGSGEPLVALHPGAGNTLKRWPISRFIDLGRRLSLISNAKLLVIEGPAEEGITESIAQQLQAGRVIAVRSLPLRLVASLLVQCKVFVGNDSGIAHLAAGLGVSSIVLFGPTLPQHWAPLGEHVESLRRSEGCVACISGDGMHTCLDNISVDEVLGRTVSALQAED